ncbi:hypothetical protein ABZ915_18710 [Streptomyces sp. NPDC046915]|uniref:hypothetical protein n=1 Tax=Streptomyces sp. NPDC046915 TaxID=3155257 RepID=UPI0034011275
MTPDRLTPYARLPHAYRHRDVLHSTVDAFGRAHWLIAIAEERHGRPRADPYDAVVVTVEDGRGHETHLSALRPRFPLLDALPDGGFVVADARRRAREEQVQVFDALGRPSWSFAVGDAVEHLLADETGDLWVAHFDEGVCGNDELSHPGLRRWSSTGEPQWRYGPVPGAREIIDCYALNVAERAAWACPYTDFPLLEIRGDRVVRVRHNPVAGARGLAVHGDRVVFFGGYGDERDRIADCRLTDTAVEVVAEGRLARPDGAALGRRRVVSRGARLYVQAEPVQEWTVLDLAAPDLA